MVVTVILRSLPPLSTSSILNQYGLDGAVAVLEVPEPPVGLVPKLGVAALSMYAQKYWTKSPVERSPVVARKSQDVALEPQVPIEVALTAV